MLELFFKMEHAKLFIVLVISCIVKHTSSCFIENSEKDVQLQANSAFYESCGCTEPGGDINTLRWLDPNGKEIHAFGPGNELMISTEKQHNSISLQINKASKSMAGKYTCISKKKGNKFKYTVNLSVYEPLYFINRNENQFLIKGQDSKIICEPIGENSTLITWLRVDNETVELSNNDKYEIEPKALKVKRVTNEDNGIYKCEAFVTDTGETDDLTIKVDVFTMPNITELKAMPKKVVTAGERLVIECKADGVPHPDYYWKKLVDVQNTLEGMTWIENIDSLTLQNVTVADQGVYECTAFNKAGKYSKPIEIEVQTPVVITKFESLTALEDSTVQLVCEAEGRPTPEIRILDENQNFMDKIQEYREINVSNAMRVLTFLKVNKVHDGHYTCVATNPVVNVSKSAELTVFYKPYFENKEETIWGWLGESVDVSCAHTSNPSSQHKWRFRNNEIPTEEEMTKNKVLIKENINNLEKLQIFVDNETEFGTYECIAFNDYGETTKVIHFKEGFKPTIIEHVGIYNLTSKAIEFNILPPEYEGPPIIGFTAEYDESENYEITSIHRNRTWALNRPFKVDKLKPETNYTFRFAAINRVGYGAWSEPFNVQTSRRTVPDMPILGDNTIPKDDSIVLQWSKPDDTDDPVDVYFIKTCYEDEELICEEVSFEPMTTIKLVGLKSNQTYVGEIIAHNSRGNSSAANFTFTTLVKQIPLTLTASAIIGICVTVLLVLMVAVDLILFCWRKQGIIACCYYRKDKKQRDDNLMSRDKKGLLRQGSSPSSHGDTLKKEHKEFEYNKTTGIITGKHSAV